MDKKTGKLVECKIGRQKDGGTKRQVQRLQTEGGRQKDRLTELKSDRMKGKQNDRQKIKKVKQEEKQTG